MSRHRDVRNMDLGGKEALHLPAEASSCLIAEELADDYGEGEETMTPEQEGEQQLCLLLVRLADATCRANGSCHVGRSAAAG